MAPPTLLKVVGGVGVVGLGIAIWMEQRGQSRYRQQDFYKKSVLLLQDYGPAAQFLGKPILSGRVKIGDESRLKVDDVSAKLAIPLKGSINKGTLFVEASRIDKEAQWEIDKLDLEVFCSPEHQKWTFYVRADTESHKDQTWNS